MSPIKLSQSYPISWGENITVYSASLFFQNPSLSNLISLTSINSAFESFQTMFNSFRTLLKLLYRCFIHLPFLFSFLSYTNIDLYCNSILQQSINHSNLYLSQVQHTVILRSFDFDSVQSLVLLFDF